MLSRLYSPDGMGFVLDSRRGNGSYCERSYAIEMYLFPYLNGEDLNTRFDQSPSRWVINFHDMPLERAETYPDCMKIVREKVKPERDQHTDSKFRTIMSGGFITRTRMTLLQLLQSMKRVLVITYCYIVPCSSFLLATRIGLMLISDAMLLQLRRLRNFIRLIQSIYMSIGRGQYSSSLETRLNLYSY